MLQTLIIIYCFFFAYFKFDYGILIILFHRSLSLRSTNFLLKVSLISKWLIKGNLKKKKNSCRQFHPQKNILHSIDWKKIPSTWKFPTPYHFSNGPSPKCWEFLPRTRRLSDILLQTLNPTSPIPHSPTLHSHSWVRVCPARRSSKSNQGQLAKGIIKTSVSNKYCIFKKVQL